MESNLVKSLTNQKEKWTIGYGCHFVTFLCYSEESIFSKY